MRRELITIALCIAAPAAADSDLVIVGPVAVEKAQATHVRHIKKALETAKLAPSAWAVSAECIADPACLHEVGIELGAKRLLALATAGDAKAGVALSFRLVDITGKELVAHRDVAILD